MPVVVLTGMRQCGKSTFLQNDGALAKRRYFSLDRFADLEAFRRNAEAILEIPEPLSIDEAQRHPELMEAIKVQVDRENQRPGRFLLSGSANFSLLRGITESLAGRAIYIEMGPMTRRELMRSVGKKPFLREFYDSPGGTRIRRPAKRLSGEEILRGGMPRVALGNVRNTAIWFAAYEQTYIERDVRLLSQVADLVAFRRSVRLAALRTAKILKVSELARDAQLPVSTLARYLGVMESSCLLRRIPPFLQNPASRLIKSPKLYVADAGLAAHLGGVSDISPSSDSLLRGPLIETYVAQNLSAILSSRWPEASMYFWSVQGRHEVDFVIKSGTSCIAIEVKASTRWSERDLSGLQAFLLHTPECRAAILAYGGSDIVNLGNRLYAIPTEAVIS